VVEPVADHGRDDARGAVGGGGDDLAAGGVLLVHRHGVGGHPVVDRVGGDEVEAAFPEEGLVDAGGAAPDLEAAGQDALGPEAAVDAGGHDLPDAAEACVEGGGVPADELVVALHLGDGQAGVAAIASISAAVSKG
jgi:hypothetical protein